jgi:hypothetical protein
LPGGYLTSGTSAVNGDASLGVLVDVREQGGLRRIVGEGHPDRRAGEVGNTDLVELEEVRGHGVLAVEVVPNIGGSSELIVTDTPASRKSGSGWSARDATARVATLDVRHTSSAMSCSAR